MHPDEPLDPIERQMAALPLRQLDDAARARIHAALLTARPRPQPAWRRYAVPLPVAAAAAIVLVVASVALTRLFSQPQPAVEQSRIQQATRRVIDPSPFVLALGKPVETDIRMWRVLHASK